MNRNITFLCLILLLFLNSCKNTKQAQTATVVDPNISTSTNLTADELIAHSIRQRSEFDWFSANLIGSINLGGDNTTFNGQIRIKNAEEIWLTMSKLGFEIVRLRITTDSVFILNKIEKTVMIRDFSFFKEATGIDFSFDMLQDILIGNYFLSSEPKGEYTYEMTGENYAFSNTHSSANIRFDFVLFNTHCKFSSLNIHDAKNRSVRMNYEDYASFNDALYPQKISLNMQNPMSIELNLNYQKIQINTSQTMPFSIPESVKKI